MIVDVYMKLLTNHASNSTERSLLWEVKNGRKPTKHGLSAVKIQLVTKHYAFGTINSLTSYFQSAYQKLQFELLESYGILYILFQIYIPQTAIEMIINWWLVFLHVAGSVIRMMEHFLTTEVFRKGLKRFLESRWVLVHTFKYVSFIPCIVFYCIMHGTGHLMLLF